ncbi:MAG: FMN-binding protein [Anaerolineales bacterium]
MEPTLPLQVVRPPAVAQREAKDRRLRWAALVTVVLVLAAWTYGYFAGGMNAAPAALAALPGAVRIETRDRLFVGYDAAGQVVGYAAVGQAQGYGGPIALVVGLTPDGTITGVQLVQQRETPGFFRLVQGQGFADQFVGQAYDQPFVIGQDLDAVSGATFSAEGVAAAARAALRTLAADAVGQALPPTPKVWRVGVPEAVLVLLYVAGYIGHRLRRKVWQQRIRWATLLTGMVVLGFIYTMPFTIAQVATLLSGYWPDWHTNLYWYLLLGGLIFVAAVDAKNPYCSWFCPFGAFQECLAAVSGAKHYRPRRWSTALTWLQRALALTAILLGVALRRPGVAGYEPFATLFDLRGTPVQWVFLLLIALASLVIYRPFCNYLCPLDPVFDFIGEGRRRVREVWRQWQAHRAKA